jgi:SAM-dependent methyltransferase
MIKLNLGCGANIRNDWINCDFIKQNNINLLLDLSTYLPFKNESVDEILISHVLEHIQNWENTIQEIIRILKPNGRLTIMVPYGLSLVPYHLRYFDSHTLDIYFNNCERFYSDCFQSQFRTPPFRLIEKKIKREIWFGWHIKHYLKINYFNSKLIEWPIIEKCEIIWKLSKI